MTLHIVTTTKALKELESVSKSVLQAYKVPHQFHTTLSTLSENSPSDVTLLLGANLAQILKDEGAVKKNASLSSMREVVHVRKETGQRCLVSFDPSLVELDVSKRPVIQWDFVLACRLHNTGKLEPVVGDYVEVDDFICVQEFVKVNYAGSPLLISLDLETIGLDPFHKANADVPVDARIVAVSITYKVGESKVYFVPESGKLNSEMLDFLGWLCTTKKVKLTGANLKFDIIWLWEHWGIVVRNQTFDTYLVGSLLDENRSNSLNLHAKVYTTIGGYDDSFNRKYDKGRMDLIPKADLVQYAGGDTDACYRVTLKLRDAVLTDKMLTRFYVKLLQPASAVFAKMERRGVVIDPYRYKELENEVAIEIKETQAKALSIMPRIIRLKYADNLKLTRDVIIREFLFTQRGLNLEPQMFTEKNKEPSCALDHLEMLEMENPDNAVLKEFVGAVRLYNSASKTMSTYIVGFQKHIRSDGMFHPSYMMYKGDYGGGGDDSGTVTGRTSAKDPAYQTIPKHTKWAKPLRTVYVPPPGYAILKLDFSQGELRITACVADEPRMLEAYQKGMDLHSITAAKLIGMALDDFMQLPDAEREHHRYGGKAGNFGLIYGMGPAGFINYARNTYGVVLTDHQGYKFHEAFFELYSALLAWHKKYKSLAHTHGFVRNPLGRIRHLPLINSQRSEIRSKQERQAVNSPIQSCLSDMMMLAMVEIDRHYPDLWMFGMTHDEVQMYVPVDEIELWGRRVKEIMENLPLGEFGWNPPLSFVVDAEASATNLASCKKLALAA